MQKSSSYFPVKAAVGGAALTIIALVWIFVVIQTRYERREAVAAALRENVNRVIALEQYVARTLEGADLATSYVADRYAHLLDPARRTPAPVRAIDDVALRSLTLREVNLIDARGNLVATSVKPTPASINVSGRPIFQRHRASPSTTLRVNPPSRSRFLPSWLVLLSRRVDLPGGRFGGTASVQIRPSEMTNFLQNASLADTDVVSVIGLDGITRARRTGKTLSFGQDLRGKLVMRMQERHPFGTYLGPSSLDGIVRYFSHRRLPKYGLFVTSGVSQAAILRPVQARAQGYVAAAALISLVTMLAGWLVVTRVERRRMHEAEILATNARLRQAQQLARLGDWSFDLSREEFHWSEDLCAMYERAATANRLTLGDFGDIAGQHGLGTFRLALKQMRLTGAQQEYELAARLPSGVISHRRIVAVPDLDATGKMVGMRGTDQDVTPRKLLESLQEQVGHLSRIDALNVVAATLAHELNQPLAAASNYLSGSIRMLSADMPLDKAVLADALDAVRSQIHHAGEIIRRVRDLVSNRGARVEAVLIGEVIGDAVTLSQAARAGLVVTTRMHPDAEQGKVLADPVQLQQVLVNIIRNARESCGPGEPEISIETRCGGAGHIEVRVSDNGPGMPSDGRDVFSPFTTSKGEGLGVGLAICRTLVESMGGTIWVGETGKTGTIICFSLPRADGPQLASGSGGPVAAA